MVFRVTTLLNRGLGQQLPSHPSIEYCDLQPSLMFQTEVHIQIAPEQLHCDGFSMEYPIGVLFPQSQP